MPSLSCLKRASKLAPLLGFAALWLAPSLPAVAQPYTFTTLAGVPPKGSSDGFGSAARFALPERIALDQNGTLFVADSISRTIRRISPDGLVMTLAGELGLLGNVDGPIHAARFMYPRGLAADRSGNVYIADWGSNSVRKITPAGIVSTLAGSPTGETGGTDGIGAAARFNRPSGLATDGSGNVYVADTSSNTIRKITPAGLVTTLAGAPFTLAGSVDGAGNLARFNAPRGITVDGSGNVYVADTSNHLIRKITPAGIVSTLAGRARDFATVDGPALTARFNGPVDIAADATGNLYVADLVGHTIRKISSSGEVSTLAGTGGAYGKVDATGAAARFFGPEGVAVDAGGNVYVADVGNKVIRHITPGGQVSTIAGQVGGAGGVDGAGDQARFNLPTALALDQSGHGYVTDSLNSTIRKITPAGEVTTFAGANAVAGSTDGPLAAARFYGPSGIAIHTDDTLYVSDTINQTIRKIVDGRVTTFAGRPGAQRFTDGLGAEAGFNNPKGLATDRDGNVYVADSGNHRIRKISPAGNVTTLAGSFIGSVDAMGSRAEFNHPTDVALDRFGNVYVADQGNRTIRKISPVGNVTTLAGTAGLDGHVDGVGAAARFSAPLGLVVDDSGNIFVSDNVQHVIRKIDPLGAVTTVAGTPRQSDSSDGTGPSARFDGPGGLAIDRTGALFVADSNNHTIRRGLPGSSTTGGAARLANLSILAPLASAEVMTIGTVIGGADTSGTKPLLVRAAGPSLAPLGVSRVLEDPNVVVYSSQTILASNDNWGGTLALRDAFAAVGAFGFASGTSQDAALFDPAMTSRAYTVQIAGAGATGGTVLAEVYDSTPTNAYTAQTPRLVNLSVLKELNAGEMLVAGFVVTGSLAKQVLIRAVGPTLGSAPFGLSRPMPDPALHLFTKSTLVAANNDWSAPANTGSASEAELNGAFGRVGAFALNAASQDAALLVTLLPGNYTAQVSGSNGVGGHVIVEVYEVTH